MAFDPKDKADLKIVADAVAEALEEAETAHETAVSGLKEKNRELLGKLKNANKGEPKPEEIERLEAEIETLKEGKKAADKTIKTLTTERDTHKTTAESESKAARKLTVDTALTSALLEANVGKQFLGTLKDSLSLKVTDVKVDGDTRTPMVGDKSLGDYVKAFASSDEGKHFVVAPANGGSGALGGKAPGSGKTMARTAFKSLAPTAQAAFMKEGGTLT